MKVRQIYETVLYATDLAQSAEFYKQVLGLPLLRQHEIVVVFDCAPGVLLIFDPVKASQSGRDVPNHGAQGPGHLAFSVEAEEIANWRQHLADHGVAIEAEIKRGQVVSIYFRDPAGNSLELVAGQIWGE